MITNKTDIAMSDIQYNTAQYIAKSNNHHSYFSPSFRTPAAIPAVTVVQLRNQIRFIRYSHAIPGRGPTPPQKCYTMLRNSSPPLLRDALMPLYVMLANFTGRGRRMGQANPNLLTEAAAEVETPASKVLSQYAVLGRYDFVIITEASDNQSAARLSLELGVRAGLNIETLPAMPIGVLSDEDHISYLRDAAVALGFRNGPDENDAADPWRIPANAS